MQNNNISQYELPDLGEALGKHIDNTKIWTDGRVMFIKAFIDSVNDLKFVLYPKDHNPPHFHVISKSRKINACFSIKPVEYLSDKRGNITNDDIKKIKNFFEVRKSAYEFLLSEYNRLQA